MKKTGFLSAVSCLAIALLTGLTLASPIAAESYRVEGLPGLPADTAFDQYAGYISVGQDVKGSENQMFFWMMESRNTPAEDPLLIWLSGGPGCSSVAAQFEGNGPLHLTMDGSITNNPYGWNRNANLVYVDQPLQTGLSFSGDGSLIYEQYQATRDFREFLMRFYEAFPDFKGRDLFISGESYAGHFIPAFAADILSDPAFSQAGIQLKGVAIGNGWIDPLTHITTAPEVAHAAGVINVSELESINALAQLVLDRGAASEGNFGAEGDGKPLDLTNINFMTVYEGLTSLPPALQGNHAAEELRKLLNKYNGKIIATEFTNADFIKMLDLIAKGPDDIRSILPPIFTFLFNDATDDELIYRYLIARIVAASANIDGDAVNLMDLSDFGPVSMIGTPTAWPEGDAIFNEYMNTPDVLQALNATDFGQRQVIPCNPLVYTSLTGDYFQSAAPLLTEVLAQIPVLLYNGQNDLIVSAPSTQRLLHDLASDLHGPDWRGKAEFNDASFKPWMVNGIFAGYYQAAGNLEYLSVLNANHMVPLSQPKYAQLMIEAFLQRQPVVE